MKQMALAGFSLDPKKSPSEVERDREWVRDVLKRMGIRKFWEAPFGFEFRMDVGSSAFELWLQVLQERPDLAPRHIRVDRLYSEAELSSTPLLRWLITNQAIEDDYYTLHFKKGQARSVAPYTRNCEVCRAPLEQVRDMWVDVRKMGKRDLSMTYTFEVILSVRLAQMLQDSGLTGFTLRPVWDYRKPYQGEPRLFQLVVTNVLLPMASPPTEFEREQRCEVCGTESKYLKHTHWWGRIRYYEETNIYYAKDVLERAADFNRTAERFGDLPVATPYVIISQRAYRWLREQNVKGWEAEPVCLVE